MAMFNALDAIARRESSFRNVKTSAWDPSTGFNQSTGGVTGPSTASGYWQITNSTWRSYAPQAGVDISQYPTAMSAPYDVQRSVAGEIYSQRGFKDWAPYNAALRSDIAAAGGASAFGGDDQVSPNASLYGQSGSSGYTPPYDQFSPSGLDTSSLTAPGSFALDSPWQNNDTSKNAPFPDDNSLHVTVKPGANADDNGNLTGDNVSSPKAGNQGTAGDVPTAIVTAANQQANATTSSAKAMAEAALKAANTTTQSDAKLQGEQQSWFTSITLRAFLFVVGAIFVAGGLFLFGVPNFIKPKLP